MTQATLDLIHNSYQEALKSSKNIIQIVENLYNLLADADVVEEDSKTFDAFIDGLRNCLRMRRMTSDITDIVTYITITIMHIIRWLNVTRQIDIDINLHGRRKSLESDLTKLLRKSNQTLSARIRDRFGLRGVILNEEKDGINYIYLIYDSIVGILAAKNRKMRKEFSEWIEESNVVNPVNKIVIQTILNIPFDVDDSTFKDWIGENKKPNGYESLHFTLAIQPYSHVIPGSQLEVQLRTQRMNDEAETGTASHQQYKKYQNEIVNPSDTQNPHKVMDSLGIKEPSFDDEDSLADEDDIEIGNPLLKVFVVDDFSTLNIPGFKSYKSKEDDEDGIHFSKMFADRRISWTLVPPNSTV